jgi:hypothetical protein
MSRKKSPSALSAAGARTETSDAESASLSAAASATQAPPPDRPAVYLLRLQPQHGADSIHRLRAALKLLRRFGFRCISIEPEAQRHA